MKLKKLFLTLSVVSTPFLIGSPLFDKVVKAKNIGWNQTASGYKYYINKNGTYAVNKWIGDYYLGKNGIMMTNSWTPDGYYVDANGKKILNKKKELPVFNNVFVKDFVYYSQSDPRWAEKYYGVSKMRHSGCVPTTLSMIISALSTQVLPTQIADYLYYNTSAFNKKEAGTYAYPIPKVLSRYGLKYKLIYSKSQMDNELRKGNVVYIAVDGVPFIKQGYSHAMAVKGLDFSGNATVYNPHSNYGIKKYSTDIIWKKRSVDKNNMIFGTPVISVYK